MSQQKSEEVFIDNSNDRTYLDMIEEQLIKQEQLKNNDINELSNYPNEYNMYEDLKLIFEIAKQENQKKEMLMIYKNIENSKMLGQRTRLQMISRYNEYLKYLDKYDLDIVIQRIQNYGMDGFLYFQYIRKNKQKKFLKVIDQEPRKLDEMIRIKKQDRIHGQILKDSKNIQKEKNNKQNRQVIYKATEEENRHKLNVLNELYQWTKQQSFNDLVMKLDEQIEKCEYKWNKDKYTVFNIFEDVFILCSTYQNQSQFYSDVIYPVKTLRNMIGDLHDSCNYLYELKTKDSNKVFERCKKLMKLTSSEIQQITRKVKSVFGQQKSGKIVNQYKIQKVIDSNCEIQIVDYDFQTMGIEKTDQNRFRQLLIASKFKKE